MSAPYSGEVVRVNYLEVDELEVKCWIIDHKCVGYLNNDDLHVRPENIGNTVPVKIERIDDSGEIRLKKYTISLD